MVWREASVVELVIYGDSNCPFSALASDRVARLEATGRAVVEWRAVELPVPAMGAATMDRWRTGWERSTLGSSIVPAMLLPDGHVSRGLGVLRRLAGYLDEPAVPAPQRTGP